jgi:Flagellar biosynthesis protein, FliO
METLQPYSTIIYAAIGVVVALVLAAILFRLFGRSVRGRRGTRLAISEYYEIDKSRRLVLVRRDDIEHLVMIGGSQDVVIESNIGSPLAAATTQSEVIRPAPRPAVFSGRRPTLRPVENMDQRSSREEPQM